MQFLLTITALASAAVALPQAAPAPACGSGSFPNPQCCATDVLNIADLDCRQPSSSILGSNADLIDGCAAEGLTAACCVLPILGQGLLCQPVNA